jgi:integrase
MGEVVALGPPRRPQPRPEPDKITLTEKRITALKLPAKGARYVYDAKEPGLCVRLTCGAPKSAKPAAAKLVGGNGSDSADKSAPAKAESGKAYVFYRWHSGRPGRITLGKVGEIGLPDARSIAAGYRGDLARGIDVFARDQAGKRKQRPDTLAVAYDRLIARPDMRLATKRDYASLWKLVPARLRGQPLGEIGEAELARLHSTVGAKHPRTANKLMALLSVLFRRNGRRGDNPASGVQRFRQEPRQRVLTIEELQQLRPALEAEHEPWRSFFLVAMLTGARRGALARMQWADLDLAAATWRIPAVWSKNRKVLTVALASEAVTILRNLCEVRGASPWVFPSRSKAGHLTEPKKAWARVLRRAGIEGAVIHDLRRTVGTMVAADGAGAAIISAVLGHMSPQSAKSYLHLSAEMARGAVEKVAGKMAGAS